VSVDRDGRLELDVTQLLLQRGLLAGELAILKERLVGGVNDEETIETVQERVLTALEVG